MTKCIFNPGANAPHYRHIRIIGILVLAILLMLPQINQAFAAGAHNIELVGQSGGSDIDGVAVAGNYLYMIDDSGFHIINVADPAHPAPAGSCSLSWPAKDVAVSGDYAYVAGGYSGLLVINVANPSSPVVAGYYQTDFAMGVAVTGNYVYVADSDQGLRIINISDPAHPVEAGSCDTPGSAHDVAVAGNYAYVDDFDEGLRVINISDPAHPVEVGSYAITGLARSVAVAGNYAYMAVSNSGLRIINITNPAHPVEAGYYDTPGFAYGVAVEGNYAYVADGDEGLRVINISDPAHPVEAGYYVTQNSAQRLTVANNHIYLSAYSLFILRFGNSDSGAITGVTLTADKTSPQPASAAVTFTATASGGGAPMYQFWYQSPDGNWGSSGAYSTVNTFQLTDTMAGTYTVIAYAKDANSTREPVASNIVRFTFDPAQGGETGITVNLTIKGNGGPAYVNLNSQDHESWRQIPASGTYNYTGLAPGTYTLAIFADKYPAVIVPITVNAGQITTVTRTIVPGDTDANGGINIIDLNTLLNFWDSVTQNAARGLLQSFQWGRTK